VLKLARTWFFLFFALHHAFIIFFVTLHIITPVFFFHYSLVFLHTPCSGPAPRFPTRTTTTHNNTRLPPSFTMVAGKRLRVASLFSGCGGMDLGLQMVRERERA
jgi:hypothetical protein